MPPETALHSVHPLIVRPRTLNLYIVYTSREETVTEDCAPGLCSTELQSCSGTAAPLESTTAFCTWYSSIAAHSANGGFVHCGADQWTEIEVDVFCGLAVADKLGTPGCGQWTLRMVTEAEESAIEAFSACDILTAKVRFVGENPGIEWTGIATVFVDSVCRNFTTIEIRLKCTPAVAVPLPATDLMVTATPGYGLTDRVTVTLTLPASSHTTASAMLTSASGNTSISTLASPESNRRAGSG